MAVLPLLGLSLWAAASSTVAPGLQLAVVFDGSIMDGAGALEPSLVGELAAVHRALEGAPEGYELASVHCVVGRYGPHPEVRSDFAAPGAQAGLLTHVVAEGSGGRRCSLSADTLSEAVLGLSWRPAAQRRVLVITKESTSVPAGKRTFEEVTSDAEHRGIVLHGLSLSPDSAERAVDHVMRDLRGFMEAPTATLGRGISHLRQGALRTGGSYHVSVQVPKAALPSAPPRPTLRVVYRGRDLRMMGLDELQSRLRESSSQGVQEGLRQELRYRAAQVTPEKERTKLRVALGMEDAYGPLDFGGRDVLDALASGQVRPGEVTQASLPTFLRGQALEPLLDSVWDFVQARITLERIISSIAAGRSAGGTVPPRAGLNLGQELLAYPRFAPSKR